MSTASKKEQILTYLQIKNDLEELPELRKIEELFYCIKKYELDYTADLKYPKDYEEYMYTYNKNLSLVGSYFREPIPEDIWNQLKKYLT